MRRELPADRARGMNEMLAARVLAFPWIADARTVYLYASVRGDFLLPGMVWNLTDQLLFCLTILLLSVFFSVHYLFLYYVFQPYTTELGIKNPFFNILNTAVYVACYLCLQLDTVPSSFVWIVLTATTVYIIIALVLVYHFAPKTFRVK